MMPSSIEKRTCHCIDKTKFKLDHPNENTFVYYSVTDKLVIHPKPKKTNKL